MSSVFIKLGQGGSVSYKDNVTTLSTLPATGNSIGDIRGTLDTHNLYMWNGTSWDLMTGGGGGGGTPGSPTTSIQFNAGGTFAGDAQLEWDNTGKILNLNGLAIRALSSTVSLVDNQSSPTTAFSYSSTTYNFSVIEYSITRNTSKQVGMLLIANDASSATLTNGFADLNNITGVTFSTTVSGGNVNVQYTTSSTGFNASLKYSIRQWN